MRLSTRNLKGSTCLLGGISVGDAAVAVGGLEPHLWDGAALGARAAHEVVEYVLEGLEIRHLNRHTSPVGIVRVSDDDFDVALSVGEPIVLLDVVVIESGIVIPDTAVRFVVRRHGHVVDGNPICHSPGAGSVGVLIIGAARLVVAREGVEPGRSWPLVMREGARNPGGAGLTFCRPHGSRPRYHHEVIVIPPACYLASERSERAVKYRPDKRRCNGEISDCLPHQDMLSAAGWPQVSLMINLHQAPGCGNDFGRRRGNTQRLPKTLRQR